MVKEKLMERYKAVAEVVKNLESQKEEDFYFSEYDRIAKEQSLSNDTYYHYDTPCTIENQIDLLKSAGFASVQEVWRRENTTMLVAKKQS